MPHHRSFCGVGIAQALMHKPQVLILDEPTIGLDPEQVVEIRKLIRGLGMERTVILSTHILSEVSSVCDRVIIINQGCILASESLAELRVQLQRTRRLRVEVEGPELQVRDVLERLPGVVQVREDGGRSAGSGVRGQEGRQAAPVPDRRCGQGKRIKVPPEYQTSRISSR